MNLGVGWAAILIGLLVGALVGLFFHDEQWFGGYGSWRRRMLRLTHIALLGTGMLNLAFALSVDFLEPSAVPRIASVLFVVGAVTMPLVCGLSAWRRGFRHLFFIPVLSLTVACADFIFRGGLL